MSARDASSGPLPVPPGSDPAGGRPLLGGQGRPGFDFEAAARQVAAADPVFGRVMARVGPCSLELKSLNSPFATLCEAIVYQQLNLTAASAIFRRLRALGARGRFPSPRVVAATPESALRAAGLSRSKVAAIHDLAARCRAREIPTAARLQRLDDEEIVERLTAVRGIGRWTVEMLLIFHLGRPDVLPATDYGVRQGFARAFRRRDLPTPSQVLRRGERWRPFRTVAACYLWQVLATGRP